MTVSPPLLEYAASVLLAEGFTVTTEIVDEGDFEWVVAESDLFVLAVVDVGDLDQMKVRESAAVEELAQRLRTADVGAKRWDAYLVLLSGKSPTDVSDQASLEAIERNTRGVRRLTAVGTEPSGQGVEDALRPFVAMQTSGSKVLSDPFAELQAQLGMHGVSPEVARTAVSNFQRTGSIDDV